MHANDTQEMPYFKLRLQGDDRAFPDLLDVSTFLLDLTTYYEVIRAGIERWDFQFSRWTLYRNRLRVPPSEKLFLESLRYESPLDLQTVFVTIGAGVPTLWLLAQTFEKIWNMRLNRRKLAAEVEKAERENSKLRAEQASLPARQELSARDEARVIPRLEHRLASSRVRVVEVEIETVLRSVPPADDPPGRGD